MAEVRILLAQAAQYYSSLNMSDYWNLPRNQRVNAVSTTTEIKCWNCGKTGHGLDKCKDARNKDCIAENRQKYLEANSGLSRKKGRSTSASGPTYEREKWSPPKPGESGVRHIDGTYHAYCGKRHNGVVCGWNTTHSTGYHKKWVAQGLSFSLATECPTHELVLKSKGAPTSQPPASSAAPASMPRTAPVTANAFVLPDAIRSALTQLSDSVRTPSEQLLMDSIMKTLNLN